MWRWLAEDAIRPWQHRSWIFPRDPDFAAKAGRGAGPVRAPLPGRRLEPGEFVISADEKTRIQARCRCHPTLPPAAARMMRVEHEYERGGALAYLAAWDVHQARLFGRCEPTTGIAAVRAAGGAGHDQPSPTPRPAACSGSWTTAPPTAARRRSTGWRASGPTSRLVHLPVHASWLNQIEIYFSIVQRKVLTPNDFTDLAEVEQRLLGLPASLPADRGPVRLALHPRRPRPLLRRLDEKEPRNRRITSPHELLERTTKDGSAALIADQRYIRAG